MSSLRLALKLSMSEPHNDDDNKHKSLYTSSDNQRKDKESDKDDKGSSKRKRSDSDSSMSKNAVGIDVHSDDRRVNKQVHKKCTTDIIDVHKKKDSCSNNEDESSVKKDLTLEEKMPIDHSSNSNSSSSSRNSNSSSSNSNSNSSSSNSSSSSSSSTTASAIMEVVGELMALTSVSSIARNESCIPEDFKEQLCSNSSTFVSEKIATNDSNKLDTESSVTTIANTTAKKKARTSNSGLGLTEMEKASMKEVEYNNEEGASPRYQSSRAAAIVAKTKLAEKPIIRRGEPKTDSHSKTSAEEEKWACCDSCSKWRKLPSHVDMTEFENAQWFCVMNRWDSSKNNCEAPEDTSDTLTAGDEYDASEEVKTESNNDGIKRVGQKKQQRKTSSSDTQMADFPGDFNTDDNENDKRSKGGRSGNRLGNISGRSATTGSLIVDKVDWVQCNKCAKWRKVPSTIAVNDLPDEWYCSQNTWNLAVARCNAKEETDTIAVASIPDGAAAHSDKHMSSSRRRGNINSSFSTSSSNTINSSNLPVGVKKVTQWVQCERRNCKKWRKLPGYVDMLSLPEKWYCEMNKFNPDRASCDLPEDSDSEGEQQQGGSAGRSQLILAGSKGQGALSYRRIIYGLDGRIRTIYNEKNKNGYGLFSYTETHRSNDINEYIDPTKRLSYWWSSHYDEVKSKDYHDKRVHCMPSPTKDGNSSGTSKSKKKMIDGSEADNETDDNPKDRVDNVSSIYNSVDSGESTLLLDSIRRMHNYDIPLPFEPSCTPKRLHKLSSIYSKMSVFDRINIECRIVRSFLSSSPTTSLTLSDLMTMISSSLFLTAEEQLVKDTIKMESLKRTCRRLETLGEVNVSLLSSGEYLVCGCTPKPNKEDMFINGNSNKWRNSGAIVPLLMRKASSSIKYARDSHEKDLKEEKKKAREGNSRSKDRWEREAESKATDEEEVGNEQEDNSTAKNNDNESQTVDDDISIAAEENVIEESDPTDKDKYSNVVMGKSSDTCIERLQEVNTEYADATDAHEALEIDGDIYTTTEVVGGLTSNGAHTEEVNVNEGNYGGMIEGFTYVNT